MNNVNFICLIGGNLFINKSCRLSSISVVVYYLFCLPWVDRRGFSSTWLWYHCRSQ